MHVNSAFLLGHTMVGPEFLNSRSTFMKTSTVAAPSREAQKQAMAYTKKQAKISRKRFRIPRVELGMLAALKARTKAFQRTTTKSHLVRAALKMLDRLSDLQLEKALNAVPGDAPGSNRRAH